MGQFCYSTRMHTGQLPYVSCWGHLPAIRDQYTFLELILFCLFSVVTSSIGRLYFHWCIWCQDREGRSVCASIHNGWHCDDLFYLPCSWSPPLALVTGAQCSLLNNKQEHGIWFLTANCTAEKELARFTNFISLEKSKCTKELWLTVVNRMRQK